jgi:ATP-dependent Clp protease ATP-binding subunit ClpC
MSLPRRPLLTTRAHNALALAHRLAEGLGHDDVTPIHIALGVLREGRSVAVVVLFNRGVPLDALERDLEAHLPLPETASTLARERSWSPGDEQMIDRARVEARELGTEFFGCEHLLLALLRDETGAPAQVLARHGVHFDDARAEVMRIYNARPQ